MMIIIIINLIHLLLCILTAFSGRDPIPSWRGNNSFIPNLEPHPLLLEFSISVSYNTTNRPYTWIIVIIVKSLLKKAEKCFSTIPTIRDVENIIGLHVLLSCFVFLFTSPKDVTKRDVQTRLQCHIFGHKVYCSNKLFPDTFLRDNIMDFNNLPRNFQLLVL